MHGLVRFPTNSDDHLVRTVQSAVAALAEREARAVGGLNVSTMAGVLLVQGDETALASLAGRLEQLGGYGQPLRVEVEGTQELAEDVAEYIRDRTDLLPVVAVAVRPPAA